MFLDFGYRSACCYAPIRMGTKKVKNSKLTVKVWVCTKCQTKDVDIVEYNKNGPVKSTFAEVDTDDEPVLD